MKKLLVTLIVEAEYENTDDLLTIIGLLDGLKDEAEGVGTIVKMEIDGKEVPVTGTFHIGHAQQEAGILESLRNTKEKMRKASVAAPDSVSLPEAAEKLLRAAGFSPVFEDMLHADWGQIEGMHVLTRRLS